MPRPTNKSQLQSLSDENYQKLIDYIESFSEEEQNKEFPEGTMNRNICDVLVHLHVWHLMMLDWYRVGMSGKKPDIPAKGYTWKTTPQLNRLIWEKYHGADLSDVKQLLQKTHMKVSEIIDMHSYEELFEKQRYKWTGTTSLGAYLISATSSHYDWALKLIKRAKK
jgi:hypothetical protein